MKCWVMNISILRQSQACYVICVVVCMCRFNFSHTSSRLSALYCLVEFKLIAAGIVSMFTSFPRKEIYSFSLCYVVSVLENGPFTCNSV